MKLTHAIGAMIGLFVLQYIQNYIANIRLGNVKDSFQRSDVYVCDHPTVDDRTEITLERINIKHSAIHNFGLFANASIPCGAVIYDAYTLQPVRMLKNTWFEFSLWRVTPPFARVNHQHVPSARILPPAEHPLGGARLARDPLGRGGHHRLLGPTLLRPPSLSPVGHRNHHQQQQQQLQ